MLIMEAGVIVVLERLRQEDHKLKVGLGVVAYSIYPPHHKRTILPWLHLNNLSVTLTNWLT